MNGPTVGDSVPRHGHQPRQDDEDPRTKELLRGRGQRVGGISTFGEAAIINESNIISSSNVSIVRDPYLGSF